MSAQALTVAIVAGEESGDLLAADLVQALAEQTGRPIKLVGVGGRHLRALGLEPLFDGTEIALIGVTAVLRELPRLMRRIGETARAVIAARPDVLVTVDSPDFTLRVARKVRRQHPSIPTVHYVSPTVWAWRPGRALAMRAYIDRVLCVLPFEVAELARLHGPPATYVGHRLTQDAGIMQAAARQAEPRDLSDGREKTLLLLPGSRRGEVRNLIGVFGETADVLSGRGHHLRLLLPTVPNVAEQVTAAVEGWTQRPEIILDPQRKWQAFGVADAALIAAGTVSLELGLAGVPFVSCYKLDRFVRLGHGLIKVWTGLLPNLVADRPIAPEAYDEFVRPQALARHLEALFADTPLRAWQKDGFAEVRRRMATERPSGQIAAEAVLDTIAARRAP